MKRYGIVYTCLTVTAIHIDVLHSMDTHSFINSFRRFAARRGRPELVRSYHGTKFLAGNRELREANEEWNDQEINETSSRYSTPFRIPPRRSLGAMLTKHKLEEFSGLLLKNRS